ncbi:MAG: hypothetical protein QNK23_02635 [Crocinitomicaceae bacterium]|nr:hypothetical protein [Crocinitomicaceae bacterium]
MKILCTLIILCSVLTTSYGQIKTPEQVGQEVFTILKNTETGGFEGFVAKMPKIELFLEVMADKNVGEEVRESFGEITDETLGFLYTEIYDDLLKMNMELEFEWKDITFKEFTYTLEDDDGLQGLSGTVTFTVNKEEYFVETAALLWNGVYHLMYIEDVRDFNFGEEVEVDE